MSKEQNNLDHDKKTIEKISLKVDEISRNMEKMKIAEYIDLLDHPRRLMYKNFLAGVARGLGMALGFTILFTILGSAILAFLQQLLLWNIPLIGDYIAEIIKIVREEI